MFQMLLLKQYTENCFGHYVIARDQIKTVIEKDKYFDERLLTAPRARSILYSCTVHVQPPDSLHQGSPSAPGHPVPNHHKS